VFYNDAAPLALEFDAARVGNLGAFWEVRGMGHEVRGMRGLGHHEGGNGFSAARAQAANAQGSRRGMVVESATNNERKPRRGAITDCALPGRCRPYGAKDFNLGGCSTNIPRRGRWSSVPRGLEI